MEQLPHLQARIASLQELRELVQALRALAASHLQQAQSELVGMRGYTEVVEYAVAECVALLAEADARITANGPPSNNGNVLLVVCSEHGFAGGFNTRLLDHAVAERKAGQRLVIIGRRGTMLATEKGLAIDRNFPMATHVGGVVTVTRRVADYLAGVATADIVFGSYRRGGDFEPRLRNVFPLDPDILPRAGNRGSPLHHLAPEVLLQRLAGEYLFAEITRAVMESLASENGARLRVMETADHNIGDKLDGLRRSENTLHQEAITTELLDVVTGSEAILGGQTHR